MSKTDQTDTEWYKDAVFYELELCAFCDSNADGIGDLQGLTQKLPYLQQLGVSAILLHLSPPPRLVQTLHPPERHGLMLPVYGTADEFAICVREAHGRGMRIVVDIALDGTSANRPCNTASTDTGAESSLTWQAHQWLFLGADGLAVSCSPPAVGSTRRERERDTDASCHDALRALRRVIDQHYPGRILIGDTDDPPSRAASYFGTRDECHVVLNAISAALLIALHLEDRRKLVELLVEDLGIPEQAQWALFLRNHDELPLNAFARDDKDQLLAAYAHDVEMRSSHGIRRRLAPLLENDRRRIELAYGLLLSLPGSPIVYYGNEIGMGDNVYLAEHDSVRTPMQWSNYRNGGFSTADPARLCAPLNADPIYGFQAVNVEAQQRQRFSLLNWLRRLIAVRQQRQVFGRGDVEVLEADNQAVLAYIRRHAAENVLVVANLSGTAQAVELPLEASADSQPVELLGGGTLQQVGWGPYPITLAPYGFYWLNLASPVRRHKDRAASNETLERSLDGTAA